MRKDQRSMKTQYTVKCFSSAKEIDFNKVPRAELSNFKWLSGYEPEAYGQLVLVPGDAFYVKMAAQEANPLARHKGKNVPACLDSALEFFVSFDNTSLKYLNIETNANAAVLAQIGMKRGERDDVSDMFDAEMIREGDFWCIYTKVTMDQITELFGISADVFKSGYKFCANFYKCGDETDAPHYGMWNPVETEIPDYHRPEHFGEMTIE